MLPSFYLLPKEKQNKITTKKETNKKTQHICTCVWSSSTASVPWSEQHLSIMSHLQYISIQHFTFRQSFCTWCKDQTLVITTFASCTLVIPAPVLWTSLIWDNCNLCNCQNDSEQQVQSFIASRNPSHACRKVLVKSYSCTDDTVYSVFCWLTYGIIIQCDIWCGQVTPLSLCGTFYLLLHLHLMIREVSGYHYWAWERSKFSKATLSSPINVNTVDYLYSV